MHSTSSRLMPCVFLEVLHEHFQSSPARTEDPEQAQLFMIPVYLGRYYNWFWQQWSTPGMPLITLPSESYEYVWRHTSEHLNTVLLPARLEATPGLMQSQGAHQDLHGGLPRRALGLRMRLAGLQAAPGRL